MKQLSLLLLLLLISYFHFGGNRQGEPAYRALYQKAERLYHAEAPTDESDSIALATYLQAIQLLESNHAHDSLLVDCYTKAAIIRQMRGEDAGSIDLFVKALKVTDHNRSLSDSLRFLPLLYCGSSYYTLQKFDSARHYYLQAEAVINRHPSLPEQERLYNKIGTLYYEEGNFHQSLNYFTKALSLLDTTNADNNSFLVNYYNNIAVTYKKLGRYQDALNTYHYLLRYGLHQDRLLHNLATVYIDLKQPQQALKYLHTIANPGQQLYNNMALAHLQLNQADSASFYLQKAFSSRRHSFKTTVNGLSWYYSGMLHEKLQQYDEALKKYHQSIIELDPDFNDTIISNNPTQFKGLHSFTDLFNALAAKARLLQKMYSTRKNVQLLESSLKAWESALLLARTAQQGYEADESRLFLNNNLQPASEDATATALLLYQASPSKEKLEKIFELAEGSKAAVLQIRMRQSSIAALPGMPIDLLNRQKNLQILLGRLEVQYEQTTDTSILTTLQQQIREHEIQLSEVNTQLNNHPVYANAHASVQSLNTADVQQQLPNNMSMLSYYFIRDKWLAFVLRKDKLFMEILPAEENKMQLQEVRNQLQSPSISVNQLQGLITPLYRWLVQPVLAHLQNSARLMIIPDHDLQYIPFEILANENGKPLIEDFSISYNYSAAFAGMATKQEGTASQQLGIAPFGGRQHEYPGSFAALPASVDEISVLKGPRLIDSSATKQEFIKQAAAFTTIHLATHADANDEQPENSFIAFYPNGADTNYKLFQPEIYNLDLRKTQLVILSACETGQGRFFHGEGLMSLARAFSYAGCKSVITSLWKADDASTAYITKRLHHYLGSGKSKDEALQKAKLDYLNDNSIPARLKTPAFWSHLVLIGNAAPLNKSNSFWWIAGVAALAIIAAGALVYLKRRRK